MRDTRKHRQHFDDILASKYEHCHSEDQIAIYRKANEEQEPGLLRNFAPLTDGYCETFAGDIPYMYSRGDSLEDIEKNRASLLTECFAFTAQEIIDQGYSQRNFFESNLVEPHGIHEAYSILCWFHCFGINAEHMRVIAPEFAPAGKDRMVDTILQRYQPDREIAPGSGHPPTFQLLDDVIDAGDEQRIELLHRYMKTWGKFLSNLKCL